MNECATINPSFELSRYIPFGASSVATILEQSLREENGRSYSSSYLARAPERPVSSEKEKKLNYTSVSTDNSTIGYEPKGLQMVLREGIVLIGGAAALLLQVANPRIGQGVNEHSNFAYRPVDRLRKTLRYIYSIAFGTAEEKAAVIRMVHSIHARVRGSNYSADDPDLQLWVAATLYAFAINIYETVFGCIDEQTAEKVYCEFSILATALRVPSDMWPPDRRSFWAYWHENVELMEVTPHAKVVAEELLYMRRAPFWIKAGLPILRIVTAELLPHRLREAYGLHTSILERVVGKLLVGAIMGTYPYMPRKIREFPMHYLLRDMRQHQRIKWH